MKRVRKGEARSAQTGELVKAFGVSVRAEDTEGKRHDEPRRVPRPRPRAIGADSREGLGVLAEILGALAGSFEVRCGSC